MLLTTPLYQGPAGTFTVIYLVFFLFFLCFASVYLLFRIAMLLVCMVINWKCKESTLRYFTVALSGVMCDV